MTRAISTRPPLSERIPAFLREQVGPVTALREIPASFIQQLVRYEPDTGFLYWREREPKWFPSSRICKIWNAQYAGAQAFMQKHRSGHRIGSIFCTNAPAHRVAWACHYGRWPDVIDHINGNAEDNRIVNLRSVTNATNSRNLAVIRASKSGVLGVRWDKARQRWQATIGNSRDPKHYRFLGRFDDFESAVVARKTAEVELEYHPNHGRLKVEKYRAV